MKECSVSIGDLLCEGQIDVGLICTINRTMPALLIDPFFATEEVFCEELVVIVSSNHVLAGQKTITCDMDLIFSRHRYLAIELMSLQL